MLGLKPRPSGRAARAPNCWAIFSAPVVKFLLCCFSFHFKLLFWVSELMPSNWWSRCQDLLSFLWVSGGSINHFMALYRGSGSISDVWGLAAFRPPSYFSFCSTTDHPKKAWTLSLLVPTTSSIHVSTQTPPRSIFPIIKVPPISSHATGALCGPHGCLVLLLVLCLITSLMSELLWVGDWAHLPWPDLSTVVSHGHGWHHRYHSAPLPYLPCLNTAVA